jgi:hypothetical protein
VPETPITTARAREINALVVAAWLVREGLSDDPLPDLSTVPLADCIAASNAVAGLPGTRNADGSTTILCRVVASRIPTLYAWAVATAALERICREHADG